MKDRLVLLLIKLSELTLLQDELLLYEENHSPLIRSRFLISLSGDEIL